jgi:hypothetical protein
MVVWLVPIFLTLHNAEEALAFRRYMPRMRTLLPEPFASLEASLSYATMLVALAIISALAFTIALAAAVRPNSRGALWALLALEATVGVNVIAHVLSAAIVFHGYGPGLATALAINAPFAIYFFRRAWRERWLSASALRATVPGALILHGPILVGGLWLAGRTSGVATTAGTSPRLGRVEFMLTHLDGKRLPTAFVDPRGRYTLRAARLTLDPSGDLWLETDLIPEPDTLGGKVLRTTMAETYRRAGPDSLVFPAGPSDSPEFFGRLDGRGGLRLVAHAAPRELLGASGISAAAEQGGAHVWEFHIR